MPTALIDWRRLVEEVWQGKTVKEAGESLGYDYGVIRYFLSANQPLKSLLVDTAMLAKAREDILTGM